MERRRKRKVNRAQEKPLIRLESLISSLTGLLKAHYYGLPLFLKFCMVLVRSVEPDIRKISELKFHSKP